MEAASTVEKLVSGCHTMAVSKVFGPLFHDPSLEYGDRWILLIFQYTPHPEERKIASKNTSSTAVPEGLRREAWDGKHTYH